MKTLYFEMAGNPLNDMNDVGTGRIRTAFTDKDGNKVFLEMIASRKNKYTKSMYAIWDVNGFICDCQFIEKEKDGHYGIRNAAIKDKNIPRAFEWTMENILKTVNKIGGQFDEVIISRSGYRVFGERENYQFGDEYQEGK